MVRRQLSNFALCVELLQYVFTGVLERHAAVSEDRETERYLREREREREREKGLRGIFLDVCQGRRLKFGGSSSSLSYVWTMVCLSKRRDAGRQLDWKEHEALGSYSATTCM
jgi:hypothetical protein